MQLPEVVYIWSNYFKSFIIRQGIKIRAPIYQCIDRPDIFLLSGMFIKWWTLE